MPTWKRSHKSKGAPAASRRKRALVLLTEDLKTGRIRTGNMEDPHRPMDEKDRTRIMKEIENLNKKS